VFSHRPYLFSMPDSLMTNSWSLTVAVTKNAQSNRIYVSVGIVWLSHVRARQCTSTPSSREGWVFGSQDARFHVPMLLSADTMNIFHQRTRLSSPSKQVSNWQHQLRLASLYPWHIDVSVTSRLNQLPYFVKIFWVSISSAITGKNYM